MGIDDDLALEFREAVPSLRKGECLQLARLALAMMRRERDPIRIDVVIDDPPDEVAKLFTRALAKFGVEVRDVNDPRKPILTYEVRGSGELDRLRTLVAGMVQGCRDIVGQIGGNPADRTGPGPGEIGEWLRAVIAKAEREVKA